jgi:hypothetical protein
MFNPTLWVIYHLKVPGERTHFNHPFSNSAILYAKTEPRSEVVYLHRSFVTELFLIVPDMGVLNI